jgi:cell division protein FtsN
MGRREGRGSRREDGPKTGRRGGGLFAGLLIGLTMGIAISAGLAWYLNMMPSKMKPVASVPATPAPVETRIASSQFETAAAPSPPEETAAAKPAQQALPLPPVAKAKSHATPKTETPPRPKVNYTFYGILPGNKPARPVEPPPSKETWWLQIAALSDRKKAEQIRARLTLLNLPASTQKIDSNGQPLYRIRVGPYKREDDAFGDLDILTENDFNARLLKDPVNPK